jgi:hypothetical protein
MPIPHTCACGHHLELDEQQLGTSAQCPSCGRSFTVGAAQVTAAPVSVPSLVSELKEEDDERTVPDIKIRRRRKKRKGKRKATFLGLFPVAALEGTFLGVSIGKWLAIAVTILVFVLLAWLLVPELGSGPYYTIEQFADPMATKGKGTVSADSGIIVHIHRTPAGTVQERIVTRTSILDLTGKLVVRDRDQATRSGGTSQGNRQVMYQIEWNRQQGVAAVECNGQPVPRGLWSRIWDIDK